jgi:hypothetical protein
LLKSICGDQDDILINFDDESPANYGTFPCPPTNNGTYKPFEPLSAFDGENPNGTWTLTVIDVYEDGGNLNAWSLGFPSVPTTFYADADGDGYGNASVSIQACTASAGYVNDSTDCDDNNSAIYPNATEISNGLDDDCDGLVDDSTTVSAVNQLFGNMDSGRSGKIQFVLYPNPADDILNLVFAGNELVAGSVEIYNPIGQRIQTQDIQVSPGKAVVFHTKHFPQGNYFLMFRRADGGVAGGRFVIVK